MSDAPGPTAEPRASLALWDYRRRVADLYADIRGTADPTAAWVHWKAQRNWLFASHEMSALPVEERAEFAGLPYFPYDPAFRIVAAIEPAPETTLMVAHSGEGSTPARAFGRAHFRWEDDEHMLTLYWLEEYGGGVFLPFRDATNGGATYGGGRYLLDTAKGADLGWDGSQIVLDFNFGYHPSCVHDPRWSCPLAPPGNRLTAAITAGERV